MEFRLLSKKSEVEGVYSFVFEADKKISWLPGQYIHYNLPHPHEDDRGVGRWFTISSAPFEGHVMLTTRFDGEKTSSFKEALLKLQPGTAVAADGPDGLFVLEPGQKHHILIAGGIGVTPFRSMLVQANHRDAKLHATLLYTNRDEHFVFDEEFTKLASANPQFNIKKYVGDQRISDEELQALAAQPDTVFYVSGPKPMVENYYNRLLEMGIGEERVKKDFFPGY